MSLGTGRGKSNATGVRWMSCDFREVTPPRVSAATRRPGSALLSSSRRRGGGSGQLRLPLRLGAIRGLREADHAAARRASPTEPSTGTATRQLRTRSSHPERRWLPKQLGMLPAVRAPPAGALELSCNPRRGMRCPACPSLAQRGCGMRRSGRRRIRLWADPYLPQQRRRLLGA
jgi:hypothetical protein